MIPFCLAKRVYCLPMVDYRDHFTTNGIICVYPSYYYILMLLYYYCVITRYERSTKLEFLSVLRFHVCTGKISYFYSLQSLRYIRNTIRRFLSQLGDGYYYMQYVKLTCRLHLQNILY